MHEMLLVFNKLMEGMLRNDMKDKNVQGFSFSEYNQALLSFWYIGPTKAHLSMQC